MHRLMTMRRLSIMFLGLFAVATAGMLTYQHFRIDPEMKCAKTGQWFFAEEGRCVTPIWMKSTLSRTMACSTVSLPCRALASVREKPEM